MVSTCDIFPSSLVAMFDSIAISLPCKLCIGIWAPFHVKGELHVCTQPCSRLRRCSLHITIKTLTGVVSYSKMLLGATGCVNSISNSLIAVFPGE